MKNTVKPIPKGYHTATPYLIVTGAANAIEFYKKAFGAEGDDAYVQPCNPMGGSGTQRLKLADSPIMLADEFPDMGARSPQSLGGLTGEHSSLRKGACAFAMFTQAVAAPADDELQRPINGPVLQPAGPMEQPGSRLATFGAIATHKEDVSIEKK